MANKTLDIAVYAFTSKVLMLAIQHVFNKGVKVRIISDADQSNNEVSKIYELALLGIDCKYIKYYIIYIFANKN